MGRAAAIVRAPAARRDRGQTPFRATVRKTRLAIVTTHPVQYQVPWYRALANRPGVDLSVLYAMIPDSRQQGAGFGVEFQWDIPLLDGYRHEVLTNVAAAPSVTTFFGCDTPELAERLRGRFDCVIVNGWVSKVCLQALWTCRRLGIPCIVRGESNALRPRPAWVRSMHRILLRQYVAFLAIGRSNQDFYLANGVGRERIFDGPYCVENDRFAAATAQAMDGRSAIRGRWRIDAETAVFLFCGKFVEKKRPLDVLRALRQARLASEAPRVHVIMAGDGPLRPACEEFARHDDLPVTFTGFLNQTQIVDAYVAADCLVLPSDYGETWGLVVNEAMACGRAAIVSDHVGCHPDLVLSGRTGEVFPFGDVQALAVLLASAAGDAEKMRQKGRAAREHVNRYSVERLVHGTEAAVAYATARAH
jgi:glycosyltransferase involved in cell wall biosynthesis